MHGDAWSFERGRWFARFQRFQRFEISLQTEEGTLQAIWRLFVGSSWPSDCLWNRRSITSISPTGDRASVTGPLSYSHRPRATSALLIDQESLYFCPTHRLRVALPLSSQTQSLSLQSYVQSDTQKACQSYCDHHRVMHLSKGMHDVERQYDDT